MSHPRVRKPRPLGSLRPISKSVSEKLPAIPKLLPEINPDTEKLKEGIHGNAMTVPPPQVETHSRECSRRPSEDRPKSDHQKAPSQPPKSSGSSGSDVSHEHCEKEIKAGLSREKDLRDQVSLLQKQVGELKAALRIKEEEVKSLQHKLETQEKDYESKLAAKKSLLEETEATLEQTLQSLYERKYLIECMGIEHTEAMEEQKKELEKRLSETVAAKVAEIADRDQKLSRLKSQMAEALKGNSWERQQQLEELTKELSRIQEESDLLRMHIKSMSKSKPTNCSNCDDMSSKLTRSQNTTKEKEEMIRELKSVCAKFESQLSKQDKLLENFAASKGHKIPAPK